MVGQPELTGERKGFLKLTDDLKIPQDLTFKSGANAEQIAYRLLILVNITHLFKGFLGACRMGTQQADQVLGRLGKAMQFSTVAGTGHKKPVNPFLQGLPEQSTGSVLSKGK